MKNLQQAADDVGVIAETVDTLHKLLDRFADKHGSVLSDRLMSVWPSSYSLDPPAHLYKLARDLTPPDYAGEA